MTAEDENLAKTSGDCCLKGYIHGGKTKGSWKVISNADTYISKPLNGKANGNTLLYFPGIWGMFTNGLLAMDAFADAGFHVFGLDYFRGDTVWKHQPLFLSCSYIDLCFDAEERNNAIDILEEEGEMYHLQRVEHGFAPRGNMDNPYERKSALT
ncbi:hypothetical protein HD806DRAFT_535064 [Xylariaceae sp. AK1471]|nr:hypothetical protein HD806DRAFT_535064 [Xylariaceae sp. AK1471]